MSYENSREEEKSNPDICEGYYKIYYCALAYGKHVGENGRYDKEERKRCNRITGCNINILEASFALEERGKTPVRNAEE